MWKYFSAERTFRYIDVLPELLQSYNERIHRMIGMVPIEVNEQNAKKVWMRMFGNYLNIFSRPNFKFNVGDAVRISKYKNIFQKGYTANRSDEFFYVSERVNRSPPMYRIKDYDGDLIEGAFYEQELQKVDESSNVYRIERIIRERKHGGEKRYLVKFKGYRNLYWVDEKDFRSLKESN